MSHFQLPTQAGSYRWYYVDLTAGEFTAVVIFMVGSLFSPRYSRTGRKGGLPQEHAAVNFALYQRGVRRQWVLSEYPSVKVSADGTALHIGSSSMRTTPSGALTVDLVDVTPLRGKPVEAHLELTPEGPSHEPIGLVDGLHHWWQPFAARAHAHLTIRSLQLRLEGRAYHDGNFGDVPLGSDLHGWDWVRTHTDTRTSIIYRPWSSAASSQRHALQVSVDARSIDVSRHAVAAPATSRTAWGLQVPSQLGSSMAPVLLESSPFYARLEAEEGGRHALAEVADFKCFHSPWVRWMAGLRTRVAREELRAL